MGLFQTCSQIGLSSPTWTAATSNKVSDAGTGLFSYTCRDFSGKKLNPYNATLINLICLVCTVRGKYPLHHLCFRTDFATSSLNQYDLTQILSRTDTVSTLYQHLIKILTFFSTYISNISVCLALMALK